MPADRGGPVAAGPSIRPPAPPPRVVANPDNQVQSPRPQGAPPSHTDITSSGPGYGSARANAYKATPAYHQAIAHVFSIQPTAQKAAIIAGLTRQNLFNTPEFGAVHNAFLGMIRSGGGEAQQIANMIPKALPKFLAAGNQNALGKITGIQSQIQGVRAQSGTGLDSVLGTAGHFLLRPFEGDKSLPATSGPLGAVTPFAKGTLGSKMLVNAGKDAWNLPSATVQGLYGLGSQVAGGHIGNAFHMLVDPYIRDAKDVLHGNWSDLGNQAVNHPLNTGLMFAGGEAAVGRGAGAAARSGLLGDAAKAAASTAREPLALGTIAGSPAPIFDERSYSPNVITKAFQVSRENVLRRRGINPNIARPAPRFVPTVLHGPMHLGPEAKLQRISDEMTAVRQMSGRQERARALGDMHKARPSKAARNVVSHVLQGVIRTPHTAVEDALKEINRLKAAQTGKRTVGEIWNRKQVRDLTTAVQTPGALAEAFRAAEQIRPSLHAQDAYLVAHGLLDPEQAARSKLFPYAQAHMGAKYDHARGELVDARGAPLSTEAILAHVRGERTVEPTNVRLRQGSEAAAPVREAAAQGEKAAATERPVQAPGGPARLRGTDEGAIKTPDPAFIGHYPGKAAPWRFYQTYRLARGAFANKRRTGEAFRSGAYDHTWEGLAGQVASRAESVTKASLHDAVINRLGVTVPDHIMQRLGIRKPQNGMFTPEEARRVAHASMVDDHGNRIPNSLELTPISAAPAHALALVRDLQHPHELQHVSDLEVKALANAVEDAAKRNDGARNVVLVPSAATQRFAAQFAKSDSTMRKLGRVTQQLRRTVLPYSTHWMTQMGSEAVLRGLLGGVFDPRYLGEGRRLMKRLTTTEKGRSALQEMVNATFYNKHDPLAVRNPNPGMVSGAAHAFPPTRLLIAAHNRYADTIGHAMYTFEHHARLMGLGKLAHKEVHAFGTSWQNAVRLQGSALEGLARNLESNPALVAKFGRSIDETFGKYNKFSPGVRAAVQSYMPFLPWYLNAARYVLWTLPAKHPVATGLLASLRQTINQDMANGKQAPLNTYQMQELARISPFGIFTPSSTEPSTGAALSGQQMTGAFLPQIESSFYNLAGLNAFGDAPLKGPHGAVKAKSGPATAAALENVLEAFLPGTRYIREAREGGKPAYGTSTVFSPQAKNEPGKGVLSRIFDPFYSFERASGAGPAYGPKVSSAASGSGSGGGWWSSGSSSSSGSASKPWWK